VAPVRLVSPGAVTNGDTVFALKVMILVIGLKNMSFLFILQRPQKYELFIHSTNNRHPLDGVSQGRRPQ